VIIYIVSTWYDGMTLARCYIPLVSIVLSTCFVTDGYYYTGKETDHRKVRLLRICYGIGASPVFD